MLEGLNMSKLIFHVHSNYDSFGIEIDNNSEGALAGYLELISIFWKVHNNTIEIITIQAMNSDVRDKYEQFVEKYKDISPQINRLKSALSKIQDNEFFFTSNKNVFSAEETLFIGNLINTYNMSSDDQERAQLFQSQMDRENEIIGDLLSKYTVSVFDTKKKVSIGQSDRQKRICRFCQNGMHTDLKVTFNKKAHAFSEALGNKSIVLNEECDICNEKFGTTIEQDFITYLDLYRIFYQVKGKNGIPKIKYKNGIAASHDGMMVIQSQHIQFDEQIGVLNTLLESNQVLKEVNIYKTLCKYVLSTIDENELLYLQDTIKWIKSEDTEHLQLPKVGFLIEHEMFVDTPVLAIYNRKDNNTIYPHIVGEFKFKSLIFVFIVPFSEKDELDFTDEQDYEVFWSTFKHYSAVPTWTFHDFSSVNPKKFKFNMNFQKENKVEECSL